ncbi:hypothetical protein L6R49_21265, partial [Myxococcota bacterium]|nr:hypothetical protein [Myxococcota bacterium]
MEKKGECVEWGQDEVPTKAEGRSWLSQVAERCTSSQRARRAVRACKEALRFIKRAPPGGYPTISKHFYAKGDGYNDARI